MPKITTYAYAHGRGHISLEAKAEAMTEVMIYGYIGESFWEESTTARDVVGALGQISAGTAVLRIMSGGGSVADGVAIHNAARALSARGVTVITRNEGQAASIAGLILCAGDRVESYANASFMIHAPWALAAGNAEDLRNAAEYLDKLRDGMATSYARKTRKGDAHAIALMSNGKDNFFTAAEAQAEGFVDVILDLPTEAGAPAATTAAAALRVPAMPEPVAALADLFPDLQHPTAAAFAHLLKASGHHPNAAPRGMSLEHTMPDVIPAAAATTPNPQAAVDAALAANDTRVSEVRAMFALLGPARDAHAKLEADCIADRTITPAAAGMKILAAQAASQPAPTPTGGLPRVEAGQDSRDHLRAGMINALMHRADPGSVKLDERGQKYNGMNLVRMAEEIVAVNGARASYVPGEIAAQALHSTSDFPFILQNVVTKTLRDAYEGTIRTFVPFTRRAVLPDFKTISRTQLGGAPSLSRVVEGAEYQAGTIGEGAEQYAVQKYGRRITISWETIVNDDLGAFTRVPAMFGRSAADLESDIVWAIITANAAMADGNNLFSSQHGNLAGAGAVISIATLGAARAAMLLQRGLEGRYITVRPEYLLVPPTQYTLAQQFVTATQPNQNSQVNPFVNALTPIVEPRLEDVSSTAWFLAASPNSIDTIEYAYLQGYEGVFTESRNGFEVDGVEIKCRHVFGAKAIDWRGLYRNPGA